MRELESEFRITWKSAVYYLGLEIDQREDGSIKISQNTHARKILERFNFSDCKPISTPMLKEREILETGKESKKVSNFPYRQAVGALMYLMLGTRPDLA
ncbi:hypothetical protein JTB14_023716 [Gonioctena quinquepunctata]|nr:hypothetical protein JTB14_023716 [Gonioctena quinquepunctata]